MAFNTGKEKYFSLQYKILLFSVILSIIPMLTIGIISYAKSSEIVRQKISLSNLNTVKQVGNNIEFMFRDAHNTSLYLIQNDDIRNLLKLNRSESDESINKQSILVNRSLSYIADSKSYTHSIYIRGFNGIEIDTRNAIKQLDNATEKRVIELKGDYIWANHDIISNDYSSIYSISIIRVINDINNISNKLGVLKINIEEKTISDIYKDKIIGNQGEYLIIDPDNKIVSAADKDRIGKKIYEEIADNSLFTDKDGFCQVKINGKEYLVTYYKINKPEWKLVNLVPINELLKENDVIKQVILIVIIISIIICTIIAVLFSNKVLSPLRRMRALMKKVENEEFDVHISVKGSDEIALLSRSFNKMSEKLKELISRFILYS